MPIPVRIDECLEVRVSASRESMTYLPICPHLQQISSLLNSPSNTGRNDSFFNEDSVIMHLSFPLYLQHQHLRFRRKHKMLSLFTIAMLCNIWHAPSKIGPSLTPESLNNARPLHSHSQQPIIAPNTPSWKDPHPDASSVHNSATS